MLEINVEKQHNLKNISLNIYIYIQMNLDLVEFFKRDNYVHYIQIPPNKVFMFGAIDKIWLIALFDEKTIIDLFDGKKQQLICLMSSIMDLIDGTFNNGF